jgi:hypothetical protein
MPVTSHVAMRVGGTLVLAAAIAGIAACGSPAASGLAAPSASPVAPTATALPAATAGSSVISEATPAPSVVVPSLGADTALIDILPAEIGGAPTQKLALTGSDLSSLDPSAAMIFVGVLNVLGTEGEDMTVGIAANAKASVIAIRVAGKTAQDVENAMITGRTLNATTTKDELDLGGKHVIKVTTTIAPLPFYMYKRGDVSFTVAGAEESIVAEALSKLP